MIRPIQETDYEGLATLFRDNNRPEITRYFRPFPLTANSAYQITLTRHLDRSYVAVEDGRIVALCMLRGWDEGYATPSLGVLVDYRHEDSDLERQLIEFAIDEARRLGCARLRLTAEASNTRGLALFEALGFREQSRMPYEIDGIPDQKIVMFRDLTE
jgi:ribosomal protein S18 acetylase RimI-like enzyme